MLISLKNICYNIGKLNISINKIMNDVNTQQPINQTQPERDQNVFSFMLQLVQEKFGLKVNDDHADAILIGYGYYLLNKDKINFK